MSLESAFHSKQGAVIQHNQAASRSVDISNQRKDDGDKKWKQKSRKNWVTAGDSRLPAGQPQTTSGDTQQQQPDGARHVIALGSDARRLQINGFVETDDKTCGNGGRLSRGGGNCLIPEAFMQVDAAFLRNAANRCENCVSR